jgi:two-component system cell cycle response regulator
MLGPSMAESATKPRAVHRRRGRRPDARPFLVVLLGPGAGTSVSVGPAATVIGRGERADLRIDDEGLSRAHAKVVAASDGIVTIMDLESTNGTYLNGDRIELALLREGDELQLGPDVVLRFTYDPAAAAGDAKHAATSAKRPALTRRELEVARLVAQGLTSAVIAERLAIKERTVTSHLDHICARLGLGSRAALTRWLADAGLL